MKGRPAAFSLGQRDVLGLGTVRTTSLLGQAPRRRPPPAWPSARSSPSPPRTPPHSVPETSSTSEAAERLGVDRSVLDSRADEATRSVPEAVIRVGAGTKRATYRWRVDLLSDVFAPRSTDARGRSTGMTEPPGPGPSAQRRAVRLCSRPIPGSQRGHLNRADLVLRGPGDGVSSIVGEAVGELIREVQWHPHAPRPHV